MIHVLSEGNDARCPPPRKLLLLLFVGSLTASMVAALWAAPACRLRLLTCSLLCSPPLPPLVGGMHPVSSFYRQPLTEMFGPWHVSSCTGRQQGLNVTAVDPPLPPERRRVTGPGEVA